MNENHRTGTWKIGIKSIITNEYKTESHVIHSLNYDMSD